MFNVAKSTFGSFIEESNQGEKATAKLTQALQNQGINSKSLVTDLQQFAAMRQQMTGIDDDATVGVMGMLTAMGLQGQALKDATVATQDLSSLMDGDMQGAVKVIATAFDGDAGMLKKYIKNLDEADIKQRGATSIIEQLTKAVGGQAEAMGNTGAGAIAKFEANWNDLKQSMGDILKNYLAPIVSWLSELLKAVIAGGPVMHAFALGVVALSAAFMALGTSMGGLPFIIGGIVTGAMMLVSWLGVMSNENEKLAKVTGVTDQELNNLTATIARFKSEINKGSQIKGLQEEVVTTQKSITEINEKLDTSTAKLVKYAKYLALYKGELNESDKSAKKALEGYIAEEKAHSQQLLDQLDAAKKRLGDLESIHVKSRQKELERSKTSQELTLENEEKALTFKTTSEEEKQRIAAEYAVKRIELERDMAIKTLQVEQTTLEAQKALVKNDPLKLLELESNIRQINKDIAAAQANAGKKIEGIGLDTTGKDAERKKELAADNAEYLAQKALEKKRRADQDLSIDSYLDNAKKLDAAKKKYAANEKKYLAETNKSNRDALKIKLETDLEEINSIEAKIQAQLEATKQTMLSAAQEYDASKNLGEQIHRQVAANIRAYIAEMVMSYIKAVVASTGIFALVLAPAAGLAMQALLEKIIPKFGGGGSVEGPEGIDNVPAMLTNKEFIVRREIAEPNRRFLEAMNAGQITIARHTQGGSVGGTVYTGGSSGVMDLKKEFAALRKQLKKLVPQVNIFAETDMSKYDKTEKKLQRTRAAYAL
jgi:hypothetical protein